LPQAIATLYLTTLSRYPTANELKVATSYVQTVAANRRIGVLDLAWALVNTSEFLYKH
jgi:hypothetical protein